MFPTCISLKRGWWVVVRQLYIGDDIYQFSGRKRSCKYSMSMSMKLGRLEDKIRKNIWFGGRTKTWSRWHRFWKIISRSCKTAGKLFSTQVGWCRGIGAPRLSVTNKQLEAPKGQSTTSKIKGKNLTEMRRVVRIPIEYGRRQMTRRQSSEGLKVIPNRPKDEVENRAKNNRYNLRSVFK